MLPKTYTVCDNAKTKPITVCDANHHHHHHHHHYHHLSNISVCDVTATLSTTVVMVLVGSE